LLTGIGQRGSKGNNNFLVVDGESMLLVKFLIGLISVSATRVEMIEDAFSKFVSRDDIGMILINQSVSLLFVCSLC
jgi:hypothetical protein